MSRVHLPRLTRAITQQVEASAERLRASGALDRRDFLRLLGLGLAVPLATACGVSESATTKRLLAGAEHANEKLERWLLRTAQGRDRVPIGRHVAGEAFPSYFVSDTVPTWNTDMRGAWMLEVNGAVQHPLRLGYDELRTLARTTQRVNHYCVEGWNAVAEFQGVPFTTLARLARPTADAGYVDFASFDSAYHESWDVESAMHPQTLVVVAKDGKALSPRYGAPARVHSPVKLGYKNTKYLTRITFMPRPNGGYWSDEGYEWFGGT
jgi:DMSO/TMAO reductase YedYZ molybdopterin-dependent catalytic subunit